jgi:1,4-dihydroxy-2-naphthoyl-CoA hydrolase
MFDLEKANQRNLTWLSGQIGVKFTHLAHGEVDAELPVTPQLLSPVGVVNGGLFVLLADICCGLGAVSSLPEGAKGFTTVESKTNHLKSIKEGTILCKARLVSGGRKVQVWDATVYDKETYTPLALFRCSQLLSQ